MAKHLKVKKPAKRKSAATLPSIALSDEDMQIVKNGVRRCWGYIAPDAEEMCEGDNECAVEMCIDADRMTSFCGEDGKKAAEIVSRLYRDYPTGKALSYLSRNIQLL